MIEETRLDLVQGSDNVFRDLGGPDADLKHAKAVLAAQIVAALDESALTVRKASEATGFAAADFSRGDALAASHPEIPLESSTGGDKPRPYTTISIFAFTLPSPAGVRFVVCRATASRDRAWRAGSPSPAK